uniref:Uncharacterized protein n=1 Tax=Parascaris equorum TaxID=6256 RepID=A0A914S3V0_PAREQ
MSDIHCSSGEHVGRSNEARVADLIAKLLRLFNTVRSRPLRLQYQQFVEMATEFETVFSDVDVIW